MTGIEIVAVGYLFAWLKRKGKRVAERLDTEVDAAMDAGMDKLHALVAGKLGADPGLLKLEQEAASDQEQPGDRTAQRVRLALEEATEEDSDFADALRELVARLEAAPRAGVSATSGGVAAGGDITVSAETGSVAAVTLSGGVTLNPSPPVPPQG